MEDQRKQLEVSSVGLVAAGVVVGLGFWNLLDGFVRYIFCPLIAAFIGSSRFQLNSFTINASKVPYGAFLETLFAAVLVILLVSLAVPDWRRQLNGRVARRVGKE